MAEGAGDGASGAGIDVDVANLGLPGGSPIDYANIAARAVPTLKPDLVLVGVLQGDDLSQLRAAAPATTGRWPHEVRETLHRIETTLFPHLTLLVGAAWTLHHGPSALSVNTTWKDRPTPFSARSISTSARATRGSTRASGWRSSQAT